MRIKLGQFVNVVAGWFRQGAHLYGDGQEDLGHLLGSQRFRQRGVIPSARLLMATNPSPGDKVAVGSVVVEFDNHQPPVAKGGAANYAVTIGGDVGTTLVTLASAVNGGTDAKNIAPGTAPLLPVKALGIAGGLEVLLADAPGGSPLAMKVPTAINNGSIPTSATLTAQGDGWDVGDLNASGKALEDQDGSLASFAVTAEMLKAKRFSVRLPFVPSDFLVFVTAAGVPVLRTDVFSVDGSSIKVALSGGGAPALQQGDAVRIFAWA
jgi:hypothetical protein